MATLGNPGGQIIHHDVIATPQNTLYFMTRTPQTVDGTSWVGEVLWEWNPDTGNVVQRWSAFDFLSPSTDVGPRSRTSDWLHANSLNIGPTGNILISLPFLNQIIAITPDFSALAWRLGGPNATIFPDSAATFTFEHAAAELETGRVLMFDNRREQTVGGVYSRALELAASVAPEHQLLPHSLHADGLRPQLRGLEDRVPVVRDHDRLYRAPTGGSQSRPMQPPPRPAARPSGP